MYIAITPQSSGLNYSGSVGDFVDYLGKENEGASPERMEHFFDQYNDRVSPEHVIKDIDGNKGKLSKKDPKFYSLVVSPSAKELAHIGNNPEKMRMYVRELMKDYAASFHREKPLSVDDIKYYAKVEHGREFKGTDYQVKENQPYATEILKLKQELRRTIDYAGEQQIEELRHRIDLLEEQAPHKQNGKRIVQGMHKDGDQRHIHIIVSRMDATNSFSVSPGSAYKESVAQLNGKKVYRGFNREKFFKSAEATFDRTFGYNRNFIESYKAKTMLAKDPKSFFSVLSGLPTSQKHAALSMLHKGGINVPRIPTNKAQLAFKAIMKLKQGLEAAMRSGSIGI